MSEETSAKRINKYISETGYCSRREADRLVEAGKVTVNGVIASLGTKVATGDEVRVNNQLVSIQKEPLYIAFHKPIGITCTTLRTVPDNIVEYINHPERIFPVGRLDKPSEGLIFLTTDGDIVNKILRAGNQHEKEYVVTVDRPITDDFIQRMSNGVAIMDTVTRKCKVTRESNYRFRIILTQGLNRQIRRMCKTLGYQVTKLVRVRIMNIHLDGLQEGQWRYFTKEELLTIHELVANSVMTAEASVIDDEE